MAIPTDKILLVTPADMPERNAKSMLSGADVALYEATERGLVFRYTPKVQGFSCRRRPVRVVSAKHFTAHGGRG